MFKYDHTQEQIQWSLLAGWNSPNGQHKGATIIDCLSKQFVF